MKKIVPVPSLEVDRKKFDELAKELFNGAMALGSRTLMPPPAVASALFRAAQMVVEKIVALEPGLSKEAVPAAMVAAMADALIPAMTEEDKGWFLKKAMMIPNAFALSVPVQVLDGVIDEGVPAPSPLVSLGEDNAGKRWAVIVPVMGGTRYLLGHGAARFVATELSTLLPKIKAGRRQPPLGRMTVSDA